MADHSDSDDSPEFPDIDPDILSRAERAVSALGQDFAETILLNLAEMDGLIDRLAADDAAGRSPLLTHAHDMAGMGGSFGFPLVSRLGRSLYNFIESREQPFTSTEITVLRAHIDAARKLMDENFTDEDTAERLVAALEASGPA